jgi:hypothetical protein
MTSFAPTDAQQVEQVAKLQQDLAAAQFAARAALRRAEFAETERDGLIDTLESAFGQICDFKHANGMSDDDDITGRWFKQLLRTLRESEAANSAANGTDQGGGFGSVLDDVEMMNTSYYSGTALSRSIAEEASFKANFGIIEPLPLPRGGSSGSGRRNNNSSNNSTRRTKSPAKPRKARQKSNGEAKTYRCDLCSKNFAGASGLWYHNKHVHGAETQLRPRKPKKTPSPGV